MLTKEANLLYTTAMGAKRSLLDRIFGRFWLYRKMCGGHWERLHLDFMMLDEDSSSPWIRKDECYGKNIDANDILCMIVLECEHDGRSIEPEENKTRWNGFGLIDLSNMEALLEAPEDSETD
jgi:hypothetical protein